ncbi:LacI family DNA-binding transcriptional regulator [Sphingomonas sp. BAUL-RG-20F-R05-02]|uniref:LacI family DNA-binding transcriptional regulator n=1 Tax=Sphingomonas sp. BAUL-RG-20F-R05-02 TaxID=2914830 RepID=UPI001F5AE9CD|nr:LacI family DNA-binding transcriptional regulator [Sphingomonas sp. BAUL-RG-20F-R05-02]
MAHATIRDVAREAAVSVASVSRVLNGHENVRPALRQRVEAAAATLGYVMHAGARNLSLARANAIGVVLPDLHGEFFSEVLRGMDRAASECGLQLLLSNMHHDPRRAVEALRTMRGRVDGMIVMAPHVDPEHLAGQLPPSVPTVLINCAGHSEQRAEIRVDNFGGAVAMTRHLIATGCRRIVHLSGPLGNSEAQERARGYTAAIAEVPGLAARVIPGDFHEASGVAAAETLLQGIDAVDGIFAANDMMALGVMVTLREAGIAVPDRIAIGGFDDIPLARMVSPALTTMRVDIASIGARAVVRLTELIASDGDGPLEVSLPELVPRATTRQG